MTRFTTVAGRVLLVIAAATSAVSCTSADTPSGVSPSAVPEVAESGSIPLVSILAASSPLASSPVATNGSTEIPSIDPSVATPPAGVEPTGFTTITARITDADGAVCEVCLWLADTADERGRGLMGVTDLGEPKGMAFVFDEPYLGAFYMFQTPTPLSIAWFGSDGTWVGGTEMEPCTATTPSDCTLFAPDQPYELAVETFAGSSTATAIGPGAVVELVEGTEHGECHTPSS